MKKLLAITLCAALTLCCAASLAGEKKTLGTLDGMFAIEGDITSRYYDAAVDENVVGGRNGILVITGDKGLAGAYFVVSNDKGYDPAIYQMRKPLDSTA